METYHALTPIAPSESPTDGSGKHAITPAPKPADESEPTQPHEQPATMVNQTLEELAREGARRMLERALAAEVDEFLGRSRYQRRLLAEHGYRNGFGRPRAVAIGTWPVEVRAPRVRDLPDDAEPFHSSIQTGPAKYKIERQFIYIDGTGDAFLKFNGTICYNGSTAYVQNGSPDSWVANRTGLVPSISRGVFTDSGGTVHVWTDMKFTRSCGSETFVGWVQLRLWFYKGGGWSDGWYKSSNGKCATEIHWR